MIIVLLSLALPLALSFDRKVAFWRKWPQVFASIAVVLAIFGSWDVWMAAKDVWSFNPEHAGEWRFLHLPAGEWLFFVCVPYACLFILECVRAYFRDRAWETPRSIFFTAAALFIILGIVFHDLGYTGKVFLSVGLVLVAMELTVPQTLRSRSFWIAIALTYIPFLVVNGFLTGIPIVLYEDAENLAIRVGSIPLEDFFYSFSMLALATMTHDLVGRWRKDS